MACHGEQGSDRPDPEDERESFTPEVASANRMKAVIRVITFASMIVAIPLR